MENMGFVLKTLKIVLFMGNVLCDNAFMIMLSYRQKLPGKP